MRNFVLGVLNGICFNTVEAFIGGDTVLPIFLSRLTSSRFLIGLGSIFEYTSWYLPQLFVAGRIQHREKKKFLYVYMAVLRFLSIFTIAWLVFFLGSSYPSLLLFLFLTLFAVYAICGGIAGVAFMDIVAKSIDPDKRTLFWNLRRAIGGTLGAVSGIWVRRIIGNNPFPINYAKIFFIASGIIAAGFTFFSLISERQGKTERKLKTRETIREGIKLWRDMPLLRYLYYSRGLLAIAALSLPFYSIYVKETLSLPEKNVGYFVVLVMSAKFAGLFIWPRLPSSLILFFGSLSFAMPSVLCLSGINLLTGYSVFFFLSLGITGITISYLNLLMEIPPEEKRVMAVGFLNTLIGPLMLFPMVGGIIADFFGYQVLFSISLVLSLSGSFFAWKIFSMKDRTSSRFPENRR